MLCCKSEAFPDSASSSDLRFSADGGVLMIVAGNTFIFSNCIPSCLSAFPSSPQREVNTIMDIDDKL